MRSIRVRQSSWVHMRRRIASPYAVVALAALYLLLQPGDEFVGESQDSICRDGRRMFYLLHVHKCAGTTLCELAVASGRRVGGRDQLWDNCNPWRVVPRCDSERLQRQKGTPVFSQPCARVEGERVCARAKGPDAWNVWLRTSDLGAQRCSCVADGTERRQASWSSQRSR